MEQPDDPVPQERPERAATTRAGRAETRARRRADRDAAERRGESRAGGRMQERVDQLREGGELLRPVTPHEFGRPDVTEHEFANRTYLVAQVEPLDVDGVRTIGIGALLWLVAFVALLPFGSALDDIGRSWWLWTCLAGFGLGLFGWGYCRRRRTHLRGGRTGGTD